MRRRDYFRNAYESKIIQPPQAAAVESPSSARNETGVDAKADGKVPKGLGSACRKCGRILVRGMYFHEKYCKGIAGDISSP